MSKFSTSKKGEPGHNVLTQQKPENININRGLDFKNSQQMINSQEAKPTCEIEYSDECEHDYEEDDVFVEEDDFKEYDERNRNDPQSVSRSAPQIFRQAKHDELKLPISKELIEHVQTDVNAVEREKVVLLLLRLHYHFKLTSETLYNSVNTLDLVLCAKNIPLEDLRLYAVVCYWIAAKVDTRCQPTIEAINEFVQSDYTHQNFAEAEIQIIVAVNFKLSYPNIKLFMRRYLQPTGYSVEIIEAANFFSEIAILKWDFVGVRASTIALSSVLVAAATLGLEVDVMKVLRVIHIDDTLELLCCMKNMLSHGKITASSGRPFNLLTKMNFDVDMSSFI